MRTITAAILSTGFTVTQAFAAGAGANESMSLFVMFFIAFGVLILLFQVIPGLMLFSCMLKGLFTSVPPKPSEVSNRK